VTDSLAITGVLAAQLRRPVTFSGGKDSRPLPVDAYADSRYTGSMIDEGRTRRSSP
jgi:hypothetical protein